MTDMTETHSLRSYAAITPRGFLSTVLATAQRVQTAARACFHKPTDADTRIRAERAQVARGLRADARRRVDRLMM